MQEEELRQIVGKRIEKVIKTRDMRDHDLVHIGFSDGTFLEINGAPTVGRFSFKTGHIAELLL
jgi:hypothetical protein